MRAVNCKGNQLWLEFETYEEKVARLDIPYVEHPVNDNDTLLNLQYDLIVNRNEQAEAEIWMLTEKVCRRILKGFCKKNEIWLDAATQEHLAALASEYFCRRYKKYLLQKNEIYYVKNFIYQLEYAVTHAVYKEDYNPDDLFYKTNTDINKMTESNIVRKF